MNTNKPVWNEGNRPGSLKEYAEWLNDNARSMFLDDHAHMEIIFLLTNDGKESITPVPVDQDRGEILKSVNEQAIQNNSYAIIHISQSPSPATGDENAPSEAVMVTAESREGIKFMFVNEIIETPEDLSLADPQFTEAPAGSGGTFFN